MENRFIAKVKVDNIDLKFGNALRETVKKKVRFFTYVCDLDLEEIIDN
ncbi:hypothetical protein [Sporohalobacter salinus]|nr:hypothetical protein [Sporohalobacter salinus]MBM7623302.1 DNA-binding sugar fermentation-stimulating protein [Sporohalobacter salinus]